MFNLSSENRGSLIGHPVENIRLVLTDGASHAVDSSELAFKLAAIYAFRQVLLQSLLNCHSAWWGSGDFVVSDNLLHFTTNFLYLIRFIISVALDVMKQCYMASKPVILEPVMLVELKVPAEFQGSVTGDINKLVLLFYSFYCN